jgi:hypothetical protein
MELARHRLYCRAWFGRKQNTAVHRSGAADKLLNQRDRR